MWTHNYTVEAQGRSQSLISIRSHLIKKATKHPFHPSYSPLLLLQPLSSGLSFHLLFPFPLFYFCQTALSQTDTITTISASLALLISPSPCFGFGLSYTHTHNVFWPFDTKPQRDHNLPRAAALLCHSSICPIGGKLEPSMNFNYCPFFLPCGSFCKKIVTINPWLKHSKNTPFVLHFKIWRPCWIMCVSLQA